MVEGRFFIDLEERTIELAPAPRFRRSEGRRPSHPRHRTDRDPHGRERRHHPDRRLIGPPSARGLDHVTMRDYEGTSSRIARRVSAARCSPADGPPQGTPLPPQVGPFRGGRVDRRHGRPLAAQRLLLRRGRRRRLEDHRRRRILAAHLRRPVQDRLRGRHRGGRFRPQRHLRRHGRSLRARQRLAMATASTSRSTAARPGATSACRTATTSARSASIPRIPTSSTSPRSGHLWGPNEMRGVYRSTDGGATWKQVLTRRPRRRRGRSRDGPEQSARALRQLLAGPPQALALR